MHPSNPNSQEVSYPLLRRQIPAITAMLTFSLCESVFERDTEDYKWEG
jgi:hypothetical protein